MFDSGFQKSVFILVLPHFFEEQSHTLQLVNIQIWKTCHDFKLTVIDNLSTE